MAESPNGKEELITTYKNENYIADIFKLRSMSMTQILSGLFVGGLNNAKDVAQLKENNITHILTLCEFEVDFPGADSFIRKSFKVQDNGTQQLAPLFSECIDFIHEARMKNGGCLVHCLMGISRSATICVAYIMALTNWSWKMAFHAIKGYRHHVDPNSNFKSQLTNFEVAGSCHTEHLRLKKRFGTWLHLDDDLDSLRSGLSNFQEFVSTGNFDDKAFLPPLPLLPTLSDDSELPMGTVAKSMHMIGLYEDSVVKNMLDEVENNALKSNV